MKYFLSLIVFTLLLKLNYAQQPGILDPTFANSGILTDAINSSIYIESAPTAVQQDGKIIVGSYADVQNTTVFRVTRYLSDGTLDVSFGDKGNAYGPLSYGLSVSALALQPDGKILVAGGFDASVARFTTDGILDSTYGTNGFSRVSSFMSIILILYWCSQTARYCLAASKRFRMILGKPFQKRLLYFAACQTVCPMKALAKTGG